MEGKIEVHTGDEVAVEHIKALGDDGARFDITAADGREWRVDVDREGDTEIVTSWRDGTLANLDVPEWIDDVTARLARV